MPSHQGQWIQVARETQSNVQNSDMTSEKKTVKYNHLIPSSKCVLSTFSQTVNLVQFLPFAVFICSVLFPQSHSTVLSIKPQGLYFWTQKSTPYNSQLQNFSDQLFFRTIELFIISSLQQPLAAVFQSTFKTHKRTEITWHTTKGVLTMFTLKLFCDARFILKQTHKGTKLALWISQTQRSLVLVCSCVVRQFCTTFFFPCISPAATRIAKKKKKKGAQ